MDTDRDFMTSSTKILLARNEYPLLNLYTYFNYGGQGVLHRSVLAEISKNYEHIENLGAYSYAANDWITSEKELTRKLLGQLLSVPTETIALTQNTTEGCNIALWSYPWRSGDHLLLSDCEHPSILAVAEHLVDRFGISYSFFPLFEYKDITDPQPIVSSLEKSLRANTRMVMLSHVAWNTGQILPLEAIGQLCQARQIWLAIDGAQSVGMLPLNLGAMPIDFYAFTGHKWLCGPLGVGGLYIRAALLPQAKATFVGWRGLKAGNTGTRFEVASSAYPLLGAWRQAINCAMALGGLHDRYALIQQKSQYLWQELSKMGHITMLCAVPPECGLVAFQVPNRSVAAISQSLEKEQQIILRSIPDPPSLRASVSYLTVEKDITQLLEVLINL